MKKIPKIILSIAISFSLFTGSFSSVLAQSDYYTNVNHVKVHIPVKTVQAPVGATGKCRDSSYTFALNHRGACSHHGGVSRWIK
jgi:hypothetical protein